MQLEGEGISGTWNLAAHPEARPSRPANVLTTAAACSLRCVPPPFKRPLKSKLFAIPYSSIAVSSSASAAYSRPMSPVAGFPIIVELMASWRREISVWNTAPAYCSRKAFRHGLRYRCTIPERKEHPGNLQSGFSVMRTLRMTLSSADKPCVAKNCVCTGMMTLSLATSTLVSSSPRLRVAVDQDIVIRLAQRFQHTAQHRFPAHGRGKVDVRLAEPQVCGRKSKPNLSERQTAAPRSAGWNSAAALMTVATVSSPGSQAT